MAFKHYMLFMAIVCSVTIAADNYVIINQIMYDSPLNETVSSPPYSNGEFIELYNSGTESVSLDGWMLTGEGITQHYTIPDGYTLASGGYMIVAYRHTSSSTFSLTDLFAVPSGIPILYQHAIVLNNSGETITLYNADSEIVDQVYYDGTSHKTKPTRIHAENPDGALGTECQSLHRTWAEFDESGHTITGTDEWKTKLVSFGTSMLPVTAYYENYLTGSQALPIGENYIVSVTPLDAAARISYTNGKPSVSNGIRTLTDIQYYDGLGRPVQAIGLNQGQSNTDYVTVRQYAGVHRQTKTWLSVPIETDGQPVSEQDFITDAQNLYSDNRPFSEVIYENSALDRRSATKRPGNAWNGHPATYEYGTNDFSCPIRKFEVLSGGLLGGSTGEQIRCTGNYDDHVLYLQTTTDEDGATIMTCVDKENRLLLERRNDYDTYYVYDRRGLLRYVLPPLCSQQLTNGTYNMENEIKLRQLAYCYQYDSVGNQIYKRLPGCEPQYMVYDALHQLVMKQDGNQRPVNRWTIYGYDSIGRNVYSAEITTPQTHADLIAFYADKWQVEHFAKTSQPNALANTGYASTLMGTTNAKVLTVNYYDDYSFLDKLPNSDKKELKYAQQSGYGYKHESATGLLTGTRTYNMSDNTYIATAYYYDYKDRVIQQRRTRHSDGYEEVWYHYNHDGTVAKKHTENGPANNYISETYSYTYDHTGRALTVTYQVDNSPEITLNAYKYDTLGRLARNLRGSNQNTIRYRYDMRGSLTNIQSTTFSERLFYADSLENGMTARYNGNIAASFVAHPDSVYKFAYTYDLHNRLTGSRILTGATSRASEEFTYDPNGNILTLKRYNGTAAIDDLTYYYKPTSNQLASISDGAQPADLTSVKEYYDNHPSTTEDDMAYDANGNMVSDKDRGISTIAYNRLNLPDTIQFTNGNQIVNLYDAAGTKYQSIYYTLLPTVATSYYEIQQYGFDADTVEYAITEYEGNIEKHYSRDSIWFRIHNPEGYLENDTLYFYYRDHLGNNVAVRDMMSDSVVQRTVYYASGLPMAQSTGAGKQPYKYNGKEFVEMHGLDEHDSHARWYYPAIMRTTTMDPLAENDYHISPYAWCGDNPIVYVDPDGRKWKTKRDIKIAQELSKRLYSNIGKQLRRINKNVYRKSIGVSDKKTIKINKQVKDSQNQIKQLQNLQKNIDLLTNSETTYTFKTNYSNTGQVVLEQAPDGTIIINSFDNAGSKAHELTHAAQYEKGQLVSEGTGTDFTPTGSIGLLELETEAYQTEYSINGYVSAPSDNGEIESSLEINEEWVKGIYNPRTGKHPYNPEADCDNTKDDILQRH